MLTKTAFRIPTRMRGIYCMLIFFSLALTIAACRSLTWRVTSTGSNKPRQSSCWNPFLSFSSWLRRWQSSRCKLCKMPKAEEARWPWQNWHTFQHGTPSLQVCRTYPRWGNVGIVEYMRSGQLGWSKAWCPSMVYEWGSSWLIDRLNAEEDGVWACKGCRGVT